jgi:dihydroneopterin aldolase
MLLQSSSICVRHLRLYAYHGVLPQEQRVGGEYDVDLRVHYTITRAMESDDVADTINYAELCQIVKREMAVPSKLLEHVACRIGRAVFEAFPEATALELSLTKINPPMGADCDGAGVELYLMNDKTEE